MMNKKQLLILIFGIVAIILIVIYTPRYKITWIDSKNFIKTEQTSSLYKRSQGKENLHWDKISLYAAAAGAACGIAMFFLKDGRGQPHP